MNPLGLYGVQPRALLRKEAAHDPHSLAALLDSAVVFSEPSLDLFGDVPARLVPDEKKDLLAQSFEFLAAPREELRRVMELTGRPSTNLSHMSPSRGR